MKIAHLPNGTMIYPLRNSSQPLRREGKQQADRKANFGPAAISNVSNTVKAFDTLDACLNLGSPGRLSLRGLNPEEMEEFLQMLSTLLKKGVVGYEILEIDDKPEKHFIVTQIGDERTYGAEIYNEQGTIDDPTNI